MPGWTWRQGPLVLVAISAFLAAEATLAAPEPAVYSETEARQFVEYARAAFCTPAHIKAWDCGESCDEVPAVPGQVVFLGPGSYYEVQGYVARVPSASQDDDTTRCVVAYRGSVVFRNWLADGETWQEEWPRGGADWCPKCAVHAGFAKAYRELRDGMMTALQDLQCESVAFVGHSLGAAVATLASMDVRASGLNGVRMAVGPVWTFGKPRVGNRAFATAYASVAAARAEAPPLWRVIHFHDPVPRLPPPYLDFDHEPLEVYYLNRESSEFRVCTSSNTSRPHPWENRTCAWSAPLLECLDGDHTMYLNKTFEHSQLPAACVTDTHVVV